MFVIPSNSFEKNSIAARRKTVLKMVLCSLVTLFYLGNSLALESKVITYSEGLKGSPPIRFVGDHSYAPIEYLEDGEVKGIFPEFLAHLARAMNRNVEYQLVDWSEAQRRVLEEEADVLTVFSPNPKRNEFFRYSHEFLTFDFKLYVQNDSILIHDLDDLKNKKVGVTKGGTPKEIIESFSDKINTVIIDNIKQGFEKVLLGDLDAVATTEWVGAYTLQQYNIKGIKHIDKPFFSEHAPMGVRKNDSNTLTVLNKALTKLESDNVMDELKLNWSKQEVIYVTKGALDNLKIVSFLVVVLILLLGVAFFIVTLKRQVKQRTKELEASIKELAESKKMNALSILVKGVAHEINTPLGVLVTSNSFLEDEIVNLDKAYLDGNMTKGGFSEFIEKAKDSVILISKNTLIISNLISRFKQVQTDAKAISLINVGDVARMIVDVYSITFQARNINATVDVSVNKLILLDPSALPQILAAFIDNTLDHAFSGLTSGEVLIKICLKDSELHIDYSDNGNGTRELEAERLFDPFYTTQRGQHTGLGLNIIYNFVTARLGGRIKCVNNGGLTFSVIIPVEVKQGSEL